MLWGQRLLDHGWKGVWGDPIHPVDPVVEKEVRKALVLLTDGDDTYCDLASGQNPSCHNSPAGVDRTEACAAAKAAGTEIFVIAAMHETQMGNDTADLLVDCSSQDSAIDTDDGGTHVFIANSTPAQLEEAFVSIANQLSEVRRVY